MRWPRTDELSTRSIEADPWDERWFRQATKGLRTYSRARNKLAKVAETGADAMIDTFFALTKADPRLLPPGEMRPSHLVNWLVARELSTMAALRRLREHTVGDITQAALGCIDLEPMLESIFDRLKEELATAATLEAVLVVIVDLQDHVGDLERELDDLMGDEPSGEDILRGLALAGALRAARDQLAEGQASFEDQLQDLKDRLDEHAEGVRAELTQGLNAAADDATSLTATAKAWGVSVGDMRKLSAQERLALAKKLSNARLRDIADLFGRIRNLSLCEMSSVADDIHDQIIDLELGGDLSRVVPSEMLLLGDPATELDFLARLADGELLQYSVEGDNELGRGGIVMCVDGSASMAGEPERWAKAVMLVLMHEARAQQRSMHVIHFGGPGQVKHYAFEDPASFTPERILEAAEAFWGHGTDFETPMGVALGILVDEHNATGTTRADVVFATDDECFVSEPFMAHYLSEMHRLGARTYGFQMDGQMLNHQGPLMAMCEGRVTSIEDLRSGRDALSMLRGVMSDR